MIGEEGFIEYNAYPLYAEVYGYWDEIDILTLKVLIDRRRQNFGMGEIGQ